MIESSLNPIQSLLKVNAEYEAILPKLSREEFEALKLSIQTEGQHFAIVVNEDSEVLDGHHRYRACEELGIEPKIEKRLFMDKLAEKKFVIEANLRRRQLTDFEKAEFGLLLMKIETERAKQRQLSTLKQGDNVPIGSNEPNGEKGKARDIVARQVGLSSTTFQRAITIMEKAPEKLKEKCRKNQTSIAYAYKMVKQDERRREQLEVRQNKGNVEVQVFQGDFMEVSAKLQENSIDFIITDPPYGQQFLQLYKKLGEVASRLLKPGGSLLVMAGQSYLPDVFDLLRPYLTYNWTVAYLTPGGQSAQLWERKVNTFWKPVLWFVKGKYEGDWVGDVAKSAPNNNEKQLMEWQQSESGIADLVERFTKPNDLILDPLMGSATTGVVATRLGRRFIGIDIDPKMVEIAKQRMGTVGDVDENNDKTALKMKPKVGPWNGICTEKCWYAEEKKCVCKCEGANHGRGVSKEYGKLDDFNETENESTKALEGRELAAGNLASEAQHGSVV